MPHKLPVPSDAETTAKAVLDAAFDVHTRIGAGCLEKVYVRCMAKLLADRGHEVAMEVKLPVVFEGVRIEGGYQLDLLVDGCVIVEAKSCDSVIGRHFTQVITYLRLLGHPLGFLLNFGEEHLRDGVHRIVHPDHFSASWPLRSFVPSSPFDAPPEAPQSPQP